MRAGASAGSAPAGSDAADAVEAARELFRRVLATRNPEYDEWLYRYCGKLAEPGEAERYMRHLGTLLAWARFEPAGKDVLDAGSGFGLALVALGLLGARSLHGVEIHDGMVRTVRAYDLPPHLRPRIERASVAEMPYPDDAFDLVLSKEAISHYDDVEAFLREAYRVLRPGGTLLINDGNNGLNPITRRRTREVWRAFELGPAGEDVHGHALDKCYREIRLRAARRHAGVPADEVADRTFGMTVAQVDEACRRFLATGELPRAEYDPGSPPVDPENGSVIERLFDPYALARDLRRVGFEARVRGYWGGAGGRPAVRLADRVLASASRLTMPSARAFVIAAHKKPRP